LIVHDTEKIKGLGKLSEGPRLQKNIEIWKESMWGRDGENMRKARIDDC
jgi:hypothetical protein